jgi:hypothetical protein
MIAPMLRKAKHTIYSFNGSTRDSGWRIINLANYLAEN